MGLAIIFVTHDLGVVAEMCDRVLVMYGGVTAEYADVDTIYNEPRHPYTQELLKAFPDLTKPKKKLSSIPRLPAAFGWRCPQAAALRRAVPLPLTVATPNSPSLHKLGDTHIASCHLLEASK